MRYLKLFVTLVLVLTIVASNVIAASNDKANTRKSTVITNEDQPLNVNARAFTLKQIDKYSGRKINTNKFLPATPQALSGDIHVGAAVAGYTTLTQAFGKLMVYGVGTGGVRFLLDDANYTESGLLLGAIPGASATDAVTIQPATGVVSTVTLTNDAANGGGWTFLSSSYVTVNGTADGGTPGSRDLTVMFDPGQAFPTTALNSVFRLRDGCSNITIENCNIYSMYKSDLTDARPGIVATTSGAANTDLSFDNNRITTASVAIVTVGGNDFDTNISITNNDIGNMGVNVNGQTDYVQRAGIYTEWSDGSTIKGNTVQGLWRNAGTALISGTVDLRRTTGIYQLWGLNSEVSYNVVDSLAQAIDPGGSTTRRAYGIRIQNLTPAGGSPYANTNVTLKNNSISRVFGIGSISGGDIGIEIFPGEGDFLYHNSISLAGSTTQSGRGVTGMQLSGDGTVSGRFTVRNNAFSITRTGGSTTGCYRVFNNSGDADIIDAGGNDLYTTGVTSVLGDANTLTQWKDAFGFDLTSVDGNPGFTNDADLHLAAGQSAAKDIGTDVGVADDYDGDVRDANPDAGYDESSVATALDKDVMPFSVNGIPGTGAPINALANFTITVVNNTPFTAAAFDVNAVVKDENSNVVAGGGTVNTGGTLAAFSSQTLTGFTGFTPTTNGPYSISVTTSLTNDQVPGNDMQTYSVSIVPLVTVTTDYTACFDAGSEFGWSGTGDFELSNSFTKLGGVYGGSGYSWVTVPGAPGDHYTEALASQVLSPFMDLSGLNVGGDNYVSFSHSIMLEPRWDFSTLQYSTDGGTSWTVLGVLDDPNGVNWYSTAVYQNTTVGEPGVCFADVIYAANYPDVTNDPLTMPIWSSAGVCDGADVSTGPYGYIFVQLKLPTALAHHSFIRFRYAAHADFGSEDGWAFDCFKVGSPATFTGATISGVAFSDLDGNGTFGGSDVLTQGATVNLTYFGAEKSTTTTDVNGAYSFTPTAVNLPGDYQVTLTTSEALTVPVSGQYDISTPAGGETYPNNDFGTFDGTLSGKKFNDVNDNGTDDSEPGFEGWTIEAHKDSCAGAVVASGETDANGIYTISLAPGTYYIAEVEQSGYRATTPTCVTVVISAGNPSATANFGNFKLGVIKFEALNDLDGDGVKDAGDVTALPSGDFVNFDVTKDGNPFASSVIGSQTASETFSDLDVGTYVFTQTSTPTGWVVTNPSASTTVVVSTSGANATITRLHFKNPKVNGYKFNDLDGDGTWDGGEPALAGWTINISGDGGGALVTDANGFYETWVGGGSHTISETAQDGWSQTTPTANGGTYVFTAVSGTIPGADKLNQNFGNFQNISVSGTVYRDYNGNGTVDGADVAMSGVTVSLTGSSDQTSGSSGFSFTGVGGGAKTLSVTLPDGFAHTGNTSYAISGVSGTNQSGKNFLLVQSADLTSKYRSFTKDSLAKLGLKAAARKAGQFPTLANMFDEMVAQAKAATQALGIVVGKAGQLRVPTDPKSIKGYVQPKKGADVFASLITKGKTSNLVHTGTARGLDFFAKNEKRILKLNTSLAPGKHDNVLFANLLALSVSVAASDWAKTPEGFGDLKYVGSYEPWYGMTVAELLADANNTMTNWEFVPASTFSDMNAVVEAINADFAGALDTASFFAGGKMQWTGVKSIASSNLLVANPGATPREKIYEPWVETPTSMTLAQNYPNPFNPTTAIRFELTGPSVVTLKVYNMLGQQVATILDAEEYYAEGMQEVSFDATNLTSGVYFYQLTTNATDEETGAVQNFTQTKKMLLTK